MKKETKNKKWFKDVKINKEIILYIIGTIMFVVAAYNVFFADQYFGLISMLLGIILFEKVINSKEE